MSRPGPALQMQDVLLACGELSERERVAVRWVLDRHAERMAAIDEELDLVDGGDKGGMSRSERIAELVPSEGARTATRHKALTNEEIDRIMETVASWESCWAVDRPENTPEGLRGYWNDLRQRITKLFTQP